MNTLNILLTVALLKFAQGFNFKIHYCDFQCSNSCEAPKDTSNPVGEAKAPGAYYWRDFYGVIPPDAYPIGPSSQYPQTYIGFVYDFANNGSFATTLYDGLDYAYNANEGNTTKISSHIQILCTKAPGSMAWFKLTAKTYKTMTADGYKVVQAGFHQNKVKNLVNHFVVRTTNCHINYIGVVNSFDAKLEFALIDGTHQTSTDYEWLMYKPSNGSDTSQAEKSSTSSSKSFFSHHYDYQIRPDSIIPKFYKKISIGSCSLTCTNEDKGKTSKIKSSVKLLSSMAYFWQQPGYVDKELSIPSGLNPAGKPSYIGQAGIYNYNVFDVGSSDLKDATINIGLSNVVEGSYYHVLGSNFQEKFKWVNSTKEDFEKLDKDALIPGGVYKNGTETYVCRTVDDRYGIIYPGSGRVLANGTLCYSYFGPEDKFQVLMYQKQKK